MKAVVVRLFGECPLAHGAGPLGSVGESVAEELHGWAEGQDVLGAGR
ncbi:MULTISPECIES: hypothetical protein [unclassified Streptomyces]